MLQDILSWSSQDQFRGSDADRAALQALGDWLSQVDARVSVDDEDGLDASSLAYLQSYRDQFTRVSLIKRGHGEIVGDSPKLSYRAAQSMHSPGLAGELDKVASPPRVCQRVSSARWLSGWPAAPQNE